MTPVSRFEEARTNRRGMDAPISAKDFGEILVLPGEYSDCPSDRGCICYTRNSRTRSILPVHSQDHSAPLFEGTQVMADSLQFLRMDPVESSLRIHCEMSVAPHQIDMADCKERIAQVIDEHDCDEVVFGLGEVKILSSRFLALMAAIGQLDVSVWVESPTEEIQELLKLTRYDEVIKVRQPVS